MSSRKKMTAIICCLSVIAYGLFVSNLVVNKGVTTSVNEVNDEYVVGGINSDEESVDALDSSKLSDRYESMTIYDEITYSEDELTVD